MVSPLSARLLGLQSVDGSLAPQLQEQIPPPGVATARSSSSMKSKGGHDYDSTGKGYDSGGSTPPLQLPKLQFMPPAAFEHVQPASGPTLVATAASHPSISAMIATKMTPSKTDTSTPGPDVLLANKALPSSSNNETVSIRRHIMRSYQPVKPRVRPSGYTADHESNSSSSNNSRAGRFVFDEAGNATSMRDTSDDDPTKKRRASQIAEHSRKRKMEEMNYRALTVKEDLEMSGKSFEYVTKLRPRALPLGSVDMSKVRLVTAGAYEEMQQQQSAGVESRRSTSFTGLGGDDDIQVGIFNPAKASMNVYDALIADTRQHYNICPKKQRKSLASVASGSSANKPPAMLATEGTSASQLASRLASVAAAHQPSHQERSIDIPSGHSTATPSTPSDIESDASLDALEIAPRLEEGLMSDVTDDYAALSPPPPSVDRAASIITTAIETALSYSQKARLVVSSKDPFRIVHANAAYFRLAGLKSSSVVGQSLSNILEEPAEGLDLCSLLSLAANPCELQNIAISKGISTVDTDEDRKEKSAEDVEGDETKEVSSGAPKSKALNCRMSISPVSDSSTARGLVGFVSGRVKITHYLIELAESDGNDAPVDNAKNSADATDEGFSVIG